MQARQTELFDIEAIQVGPRARKLDEKSITCLMESIGKLGLRTPVTVRMTDPEGISDAILVAGYHRLEAAKRLGWEKIECFVSEGDDEDKARMWEIAENLHRADLTQLERDDQFAEWLLLADRVSPQVVAKPKDGRPESGVRRAARELGINREDARRAVKVAGLTPEAKQAARDAGLDDNRKALLEASLEAPERQAARISEIAIEKLTRPTKVAADPLDDMSADERQVAKLMDAWNGASANARDEFLLRIDVRARTAA